MKLAGLLRGRGKVDTHLQKIYLDLDDVIERKKRRERVAKILKTGKISQKRQRVIMRGKVKRGAQTQNQGTRVERTRQEKNKKGIFNKLGQSKIFFLKIITRIAGTACTVCTMCTVLQYLHCYALQRRIVFRTKDSSA